MRRSELQGFSLAISPTDGIAPRIKTMQYNKMEVRAERLLLEAIKSDSNQSMAYAVHRAPAANAESLKQITDSL